jgi:hypothetical protein
MMGCQPTGAARPCGVPKGKGRPSAVPLVETSPLGAVPKRGSERLLLRVDGRVVFIAECMFWDGPSTLVDAITRVLSYGSWHDTKAAVLIFDRGRDLVAVQPKVSDAVRSHRAYVRDMPYDSANGLRFLLRHPDDVQREVTLTVITFQMPSG